MKPANEFQPPSDFSLAACARCNAAYDFMARMRAEPDGVESVYEREVRSIYCSDECLCADGVELAAEITVRPRGDVIIEFEFKSDLTLLQHARVL